MVNLEVVKRAWPCAQYMDPEMPGCPDPDRPQCRWCKELHHVRGQYESHTFCGQPCTAMDGWAMYEDMHPEDVSAIDRCLTCYQGIERRKREDLAYA
jgi:hypothetical protein